MSHHGLSGMLDPETLQREVDSGNIETVITVFPNIYGQLIGKRITGHFFLEEVASSAMHACAYLFTVDMEMDPIPGYRFSSWQTGHGDMRCVPDLGTLRRAAWLDKTALVLCDVIHEDEDAPVTIAPRNVLKKQMDRASALGYLPMGGSELEFFMFRDSYEEANRKRYHDLKSFGWYIEDYHVLAGTRMEEVVGTVRQTMDRSGVPVEFSKGEWGPGQHEINLRYADFLEMSDRHTIYKHAAKEIADARGVSISFMAKCDEKLAGNSTHLHASLWDAEARRNLFAGEQAIGPIHGSDLFRWFLGGWMAHAREFMLFYAPYINSYKRYQAESFAPTGIAWSYDNRTAGFRIIGHGNSLRIECRIPGGDANPYLAFAATLAAGLDGIEKKIDPPPIFKGDVYAARDLPQVPRSLLEAIDAFEKSELARQAFGEEVVEHYLHFARTEQRKFDEVVTCWERERYFERA